jgi:hypothetical protein
MLMEDEQVLRKEFRNDRLNRGNLSLSGRGHGLRSYVMHDDDLPYKHLIYQIAEELNETLLVKPALKLGVVKR